MALPIIESLLPRFIAPPIHASILCLRRSLPGWPGPTCAALVGTSSCPFSMFRLESQVQRFYMHSSRRRILLRRSHGYVWPLPRLPKRYSIKAVLRLCLGIPYSICAYLLKTCLRLSLVLFALVARILRPTGFLRVRFLFAAYVIICSN